MRNVKQLFSRYVGSIALTNDGKVYTWGQIDGSCFKKKKKEKDIGMIFFKKKIIFAVFL